MILNFFRESLHFVAGAVIQGLFAYLLATAGLNKEDIMKTIKCAPQRVSKLIIGFSAFAVSVVLFVLGITLIPVLGIFLSLPTFAMSLYIFRLHLNDQCEIEVA